MRKDSFTADFETTTNPDETRVWGWGIASIQTGKMVAFGNSIDSFFEYIENKNIDLYFHNLKFDGAFIIHYLLSKGIKHSRDEDVGTFNTLITDTGEFFKISIIWKRFKKRVVKVDFYDSHKKLPFSVDVIAKRFGLPIRKLEIDYHLERDEKHILTDDEIDYIRNDVEIMATALQTMFNSGLKKMTIASDSLFNFKESIGGNNKFKSYFPILKVEIDDDIRRSYKGGFTYVNPKFVEQDLNGLVFDVNSLYPSVMRNKLLPYGMPLFFYGQYEFKTLYPLYIQRFRCSFKLKDNHFPTIQLKNSMSFIQTQYLESSKGEIVELVLTNIDLELFLNHYEVMNLEFLDGYMFKATDELFKKYIDHWGEVKEKSTGAEREQAKLMLNSLYGKFATSPKKRKKTPYLNDDGFISYKYDEEEVGFPIYTALSSFITSYARRITIESAQENFDRFIYADTDSLHLVGYEMPDNIEVHSTKLGAWDFETKFERSKYLRAKSYIQYYDEKWHITVAGLPHYLHSQVDFENFKVGAVYSGKLRPKQTKGGVVLVETTFRISK